MNGLACDVTIVEPTFRQVRSGRCRGSATKVVLAVLGWFILLLSNIVKGVTSS